MPSSIAASTATFCPLPTRFSLHRTKTLGASPPRTIPVATARPARLLFRLGNAANFHWKHRVPIVFASDSPSTQPAAKGKVEKSSEVAADGPPLPTILAGIVVFLLFCWAVGSIVMWLVGVIVKPPSS